MKARLLLLTILWSLGTQIRGETDLIHFFHQALQNDPSYQQTLEETLAKEQNIRINRAALLPQLALSSNPQANKLHAAGSITRSGLYPPNNILQSFETQLSLNQTIIDFSRLSDLANAKLSAKQAQARLNAAFQDLILRVAKAYLKVLYDKENLIFCNAHKIALEKQLAQARQLYKAGSMTIVDVYAAESAYGSANARYITAKTILDTDKDFLGTIAGEDITDVTRFRNDFPVTLPKPLNKEMWVQKAKEQNWLIKANAFAMQSSRNLVRRSQAGHLPTIGLKVTYDINPNTSAEGSTLFAAGSSTIQNAGVALNFNLPLYSGGLVVSKTTQARHNYRLSQRKFEASYRATIHQARKSYLNIIASVQKIQADKLIIKSAISSLKGIQDHYHSGSGTLIDVLNQQEKILQAKTQYISNRQAYIINLLSLKNAAGILSAGDLEIINSWLISDQ